MHLIKTRMMMSSSQFKCPEDVWRWSTLLLKIACKLRFRTATKSIIGKNCHDQLFINEVVKIFTFQFDESVKIFVVKVLLILMYLVKYHKIFLMGTNKKFTSRIFQQEEKTEKWQFLASIT